MALLFRDRICAVIAAPTAEEVIRQVREARKLTRTLELRLDWLENWEELDQVFVWLCGSEDARRGLTEIATCRPEAAGGRYHGRVGQQLVYLRMAAGFGCRWSDLEWDTARRFSRAWLKPGKRLVSHHDFQRTPGNLAGLARRMRRCDPDVVKVATQCHSIADSLRVLALARGRRNVIAVPMGEIALPARVLALRHGSALAYAAVGEKTAPGQLTLEEMKRLYRADRLNRRTRVYGVIGDPVGHSLSPLLHNTGFHARRINAVYLPFLVRDLPDFLGAIRPLGIHGFSVTLPHKERILRRLDDCDPLAERMGAANTVVVRGGGKLYGYNTDYVGVLRALERRVPLPGSRVLLYGAGGAARAVAFALAQGGAVVCVSARRMQQAERLARAVSGEAVPRARVRREFFDAIVNCTPVGMYPRAEESPLAAAELNCRLVFDLVYRPVETRLLQLARGRGIETVSGVEMFIAQGSAQWEIWTGTRAPVAAMRRAVLQELRKEQGKSGK